jgi:hypothetical protein
MLHCIEEDIEGYTLADTIDITLLHCRSRQVPTIPATASAVD